jgi:hypothetical protein
MLVEVCHLKLCTLSGERNGHWQELDCALKLYMLTNFTDWIDLASGTSVWKLPSPCIML